jgi:hypothetical protein
MQNIPIGIIGPAGFIPKMIEILKGFPSLMPIYRGYKHENEASELAAGIMNDVEVLFFTGPIPYRKAKAALRLSVPAHYVPLTSGGLYRSLFSLQQQNALRFVSVDTLSADAVRTALRELGMETAVLSADREDSSESLIRFHVEAFAQGRSSAALTGIQSVAEALNAQGVPNAWILPTDQDIIVALERALLSTETRKSKESQIVLGLIHIDEYRELTEKQASELDVQKLRLNIQRILLDYAESLEGHITHFNGDEYLFVTTRGTFERETGGYKQIPLAGELQAKLGINMSIGVGFGRTASEAGMHARRALRQAREAGGNVCFIVREDQGIIGPLEMVEPHACDLSLIDAELVRKAAAAGMSEKYLMRLASYVSRTGITEFNVHSLADILNVTVRTTHRLLLAWIDAGLVETIGEERGRAKGRPKQIFRLVFLLPLIRRKS